MKDVLGAAVIAFLLGIIAGPAFIAFLRRNEFGQHIREDGPAGHQSKQGTPTMGGVIMIGCALIAFPIFNTGTLTGWTVAAVTVACAGIGFADDYFKLRHRRSLGLSGRVKMLLLALVAAALGLVVHSEHLGTDVYVPLINVHLAMGPFYYVFLFLVVAGATNAVNLTDGLDGLAAGTTTIALASYSAIMLVAFLVSPKDNAPLGLRPPGTTSALTSQSSRRRWSAGRLDSSGTTPTPLMCSWGTPGRSDSAGRWRPWRCSPRPSSCWWSSVGSS